MAGVLLRYRVEDRALLARLAALANFDARPAFEEIGEHLASTTVQRFRSSTGPDGERWKPSRRVLENPGEKTLVLQGHLRQSITFLAAGDQVEVGSNLVYAAIHQLGGDAGRNGTAHLDPRPFLGIDDDDQDEIDDIFAHHLERAVR